MDSSREPGSELTVYLLTMGQGDTIWERFGHTALWIHDAARGTDIAYNWGMFDFRQPHFVSRFLLGRMQYSMARLDLRRMLDEYIVSNRTVWSQKLALTPAERVKLRDFVDWNARPENRDYKYDYFRDNCSTRVRDALDRALDGRIRAATVGRQTGTTYRWHTRRLVADNVLVYGGIMLALGEPADKPITVWEEMFLPDQLRDRLREIRVPAAVGRVVPLVSAETVLFRAHRAPERAAPPRYWPWALAAGIVGATFLLSLGWSGAHGSRAALIAVGVLSVVWSLVIGIVGVLLLAAWTLTQHVFTYSNENLLLFNPVSLVVAVTLPLAILCPKAVRLARVGAVLAALLALVALGVKFLPGPHQVNGGLIALAVPLHVALGLLASLWRAMRCYALSGLKGGAAPASLSCSPA